MSGLGSRLFVPCLYVAKKDDDDEEDDHGVRLTKAEKAEKGGVTLAIYKDFYNSFGLIFSIGTIFAFAVYQGFAIGGNMWLSVWTADPEASTSDQVRNKYLGIFGLFGLLQVRRQDIFFVFRHA